MGGLIAARLAGAGYPVNVLARGEQLRAIAANGLTAIEGHMRTTVRVGAASEPDGFGPQDVVFIVFKAPSLVEAASALKPLLGPDTVRRLDEASKYIPLDQLCVSPQCGVSSTVEGNEVTVDQQRAKLSLCIELALEVWGAL